jgi:hypothetical protein
LLSINTTIKIHRTVILPVAVYGCETWSVTLREKRRLKMFENGVLRKIFRPKRDEVIGEYRGLRYKEVNDLYSSQNITWGDQIKKNEMDGACGTYGRQERIIGAAGETWGKRELGNLDLDGRRILK